MELTNEIVETVISRRCESTLKSEELAEWCHQFNNCTACLRETLRLREATPSRVVYVVTRLPYGCHCASEDMSAALVGVYATLDGAKAAVETESNVLTFKPVVTSDDDCIRYDYALNGETVMTRAEFPQYVIRRYQV